MKMLAHLVKKGTDVCIFIANLLVRDAVVHLLVRDAVVH